MRIKHKNAKEREAYHSAKLYQKRKINKVCLGCGRDRDTKANYCAKCIKTSTDRYEGRLALGLCSDCGKFPLKSKTRCVSCLQRIQNRRRNVKKEIIEAYGGKCACCGITIFEFLTIEHSWNDGGKLRKEGAAIGTDYYMELKRLGFPKDRGLEILCMNCNWSKGIYGYCPHEKEK